VNVVPDWGASEPEPEVIVVPDREGPLENMSLELWLKAKGAPDLLQGFKELGINTMMDMGFRVQTEKDMEMLGMTPEQIKESWPDVMKMKTKVADRGKTPAPDTRAAATRKNPYPEYDKIRAERVRIREGPKRSWDTTKPGTALEQEMINAELMDAIRDQDLTAVKAALEKGARENAVQFSSQLTPLQRAYDYTENTTEHTKEWRIAEGIMDHLIGVFMINGTQPNAADKQIYQERLALFGIV